MRIATAVLAIALVLAGCGGDDEDTTTEAKLSPEQKIEQAGNEWAPLFATGDSDDFCRYMTQPACEQTRCENNAGPIKNCTPPSLEFRGSFEEATVQEIAIKGGRAAAKFSNGEAVELEHTSGYELGGLWLIHKLGASAGREFFEASDLSQ